MDRSNRHHGGTALTVRDPAASAESAPLIRAARVLRLQGMPSVELIAVLEAADPEIVRRHLELHRERLQEHLDDRIKALDALEPILIQMALACDSDAGDGESPPDRSSRT